MKNIVACLAIAGLFVLAGCMTSKTTGIDANSVMEGTRKLCGFVPTATSVLAVLNVPGAPAADKLVEKICDEVKKSASVEATQVGGQLTVMVDGKKVTGVVSAK